MRDIGKNIRLARERKGYSQEQLAELLFVTRQTVSNYETGRSRPDVECLVRLAQLLDVEVTELIYGPEPKMANQAWTLWVRLGVSAALHGIFLWLTPIAANYARMYYNMIPNRIRLLVLAPCLCFSVGQLCMDLLRRIWKPKPLRIAKWLRILCISWVILYLVCTVTVFSRMLYPDLPIPHGFWNFAHHLLGMAVRHPFPFNHLIITFFAGVGLVLAEVGKEGERVSSS